MTSDPQWSPVEPGTLSELQRHTTSRPDVWKRRTAVAAIATAAVTGGWMLSGTRQPGAISCAEVKVLARDFVDGKLTDRQAASVAAHRRVCSSCDDMLQRLEDQGAAV